MIKDQAERLRGMQGLRNSGKTNLPENIIGIISGKGGTGKSFISVNLAYILSKLGKKILLIDFDLYFPNLHLMLNTESKKTLFDYFNTSNLFEEIIKNYSQDFDFISAENEDSFEEIVTDQKIQWLGENILEISGNYDFIIIDFPSGLERYNLRMLEYCTHYLLVANPEPTAIMDAYSMIKILRNRVSRTPDLVFNKCLNIEEGSKGYQNLQLAAFHFLNIELENLGFLLYDQDATDSVKNQKIFSEADKKSKLKTQFQKLAANLTEFVQLANNSQIPSIS